MTIDNKQIMEYEKYLINILGYSKNTAHVYLFYIQKLLACNNDYKNFMNNNIQHSNNTKRVALSAMKNWYKYTKNNCYDEIVLPKKDKVIKDYITFEEYNVLINAYCRNKIKILIVMFLFQTGVRSSELLSIKIIDINEQKIIINGKGKKQRIIYISSKLKDCIEDHIKIKDLKSDDNLFDFDYRNLYKHISSMGALINKKISPHMFRRGFATYCMNKNIGIYEISLMLGHENINTTMCYLRNEEKIEVMKNLF